jgi:transcriptional regulator of acetoin/glycerol metabolism
VLENNHILRILERTSGNKLHAARILGIPRSSLYRKLKKIDKTGDGLGTS